MGRHSDARDYEYIKTRQQHEALEATTVARIAIRTAGTLKRENGTKA